MSRIELLNNFLNILSYDNNCIVYSWRSSYLPTPGVGMWSYITFGYTIADLNKYQCQTLGV